MVLIFEWVLKVLRFRVFRVLVFRVYVVFRV